MLPLEVNPFKRIQDLTCAEERGELYLIGIGILLPLIVIGSL